MKTWLILPFRGHLLEEAVDQRYQEIRFVLSKPLQPINTLQKLLERGLERKQRAKHLHCLSYSYDSSLVSLQFSIGFLFSEIEWRERAIVIDSSDTAIQGLLLSSLLFLASSTCAFQFLLLIMANLFYKLYISCSYFMTSKSSPCIAN